MNIILKHNDHAVLKVELYDTPTAKHIELALPIKGSAKTWGEEVYFDVPLLIDTEKDAQELVQVGDLAYWPNGHAIAIFFGKTPASLSDEPRAVEPVNVFGRIIGDTKVLRGVKPHDKMELCLTE